MLFFAPFSARELFSTILIVNLILTIIPERQFSIIWAYPSKTCVSPFENGRNRKIMSSKYKTGMEIFFLAMEICRPSTITMVKRGPKRLLRGTFWKKYPKWCLPQQGNHFLYRKRHQYCTSSYMYLTLAEEFFVLGEDAWGAFPLSEETAYPTVYHHLIGEDLDVQMQLSHVILSSVGWISPESNVLMAVHDWVDWSRTFSAWLASMSCL